MKWNQLRKWLIAAFAVIFIFCLGRLVLVMIEDRKSDALYQDARIAYFHTEPEEPEPVLPETPTKPTEEPDTEPTEEPVQEPETQEPPKQEKPTPPKPPVRLDFPSLKEASPDAVGWLEIPGTQISYPLVQGADNVKYLTTAFDGTRSRYGSLFLDFRNSPDFTDQNTLIYGHNLGNSAMFGRLLQYRHQDYYEKHPTFTIYTEQGELQYRIFSAYTADVASDTYRISFSEESFAAFLQEAQALSQILTNVTPGPQDSIVTLSTCTNNSDQERFVVYGCLTASE